MIQRPLSMLVFLVCLVACVSPVCGATAWVLREHVEFDPFSGSKDKWEVQTAFDTHPQCEAMLQHAWKTRLDTIKGNAERFGSTIKSTPGFIGVTFKDGTLTMTTFLCLPDTIDPRGPR